MRIFLNFFIQQILLILLGRIYLYLSITVESTINFSIRHRQIFLIQWVFSRIYLNSSIRQILLILLSIFENPGEKREIRARTLGLISSWQPSATVWTRLAYSTHRPGLNDLSALVYSLIKSTSESEHPAMMRQ